jgi:hypothetical protein
MVTAVHSSTERTTAGSMYGCPVSSVAGADASVLLPLLAAFASHSTAAANNHDRGLAHIYPQRLHCRTESTGSSGVTMTLFRIRIAVELPAAAACTIHARNERCGAAIGEQTRFDHMRLRRAGDVAGCHGSKVDKVGVESSLKRSRDGMRTRIPKGQIADRTRLSN